MESVPSYNAASRHLVRQYLEGGFIRLVLELDDEKGGFLLENRDSNFVQWSTIMRIVP